MEQFSLVQLAEESPRKARPFAYFRSNGAEFLCS